MISRPNFVLVAIAILIANLTPAHANVGTSSSADSSRQALLERIELAWEKARVYIKACLLTTECGLTEDEKKIANRIAWNDDRFYSARTLRFVDEKAGSFSSVDGDPHRLMLTGSSPNTPILVNSTRLLDRARAGHAGEISFDALVGLFAHELVHHLGIVDDSQRIPDQFGTRIASIVRRYIVPMGLGLRNTESIMLNYPQPLDTAFGSKFSNGLFPTILLHQPNQLIVQELTRMRTSVKDICALGETIWSSTAQVSNMTRAPAQMKIAFQFISRCFLNAKPSLREVISYGESELNFDPAAGDHLGVATISFSSTPLDPVSSDALEVEVTQAPRNLNAGEELVVHATLVSPQAKPISGCGGLVGADHWRESPAEFPLSLISTNCKILRSKENRIFEIELRLSIPAAVPDSLSLKVQGLGLQLAAGGFLRGSPSRETVIKILNPAASAKPVTAVTLTAHGATQVDPAKFKNSFYIKRGATFSLEVILPDNAVDAIIDGYVKYQAKSIDGTLMVGSMGIGRAERNCTSSKTAGTRCRYEVDLAKLGNGPEVIMWAPTHVALLSSDLQFLFKDISAVEFVVIATVPLEKP